MIATHSPSNARDELWRAFTAGHRTGAAPPASSIPEIRALVIIPALNEAATLPAVLEQLRREVPWADVVVVDDGSSDATVDVAKAGGAIALRLPFNLGIGGALRTGFRYAVDHGYERAVQVDADGQHDPTYLPVLLERLSEADLVIGARFAGEGEPYQVSLLRRLAMTLLARTLSRMAKTRLTDVTSGFRVANRRAIGIFAAHYPAEYLGDTVESMVIAIRAGCTVTQVPVQMRLRQGGQASQTPFRAALYLSRAVVALALALVRRWPDVPEEEKP
jgi:glycosyltransferase involved in cell wall biosynthesis